MNFSHTADDMDYLSLPIGKFHTVQQYYSPRYIPQSIARRICLAPDVQYLQHPVPLTVSILRNWVWVLFHSESIGVLERPFLQSYTSCREIMTKVETSTEEMLPPLPWLESNNEGIYRVAPRGCNIMQKFCQPQQNHRSAFVLCSWFGCVHLHLG